MKFGDFVLDLRSGELAHNGTRVLLPEQLFRIVTLLVRRPGALVTREELHHELWRDDTFVDFDHGLNAAIKRLREALGDSAASPRFIETLPRRGYRFIAPVNEADGASGGASSTQTATVLGKRILVVRDGYVSVSARTRRLAAFVVLLVTCVASWQWFLPPPASDPNPRFTRLTSTGGLNADPAISPDGALVAYASDAAGTTGFDIWLQPIAGGDPLRLTNDPSDDVEPSFAQDGSRIVFSRRGKGLYTVGPTGGEPRQVLAEPWARTPRFSPDGHSIAYWTGFPATVIAGGIPGALGSIAIVPAQGGAPREIVTGLASARYPVWTQDGRLLFLGEEDADEKRFDWYLVKTDGSGLVRTGAVAAIHAAGLRAGPPIPAAWTAKGVLFATNEADSSNVWRIPISPDTGTVAGAAEPLTSGTAVERSPSASDSGRIVFASAVANVDVWRVPVDERTGAAAGPLERITDNAASDRLRSVSADGRTVVFISSRTGRDEVWRKDLETKVERQVTERGATDATLSPDGSSIAFSHANGNVARLELAELRDGGPPRLLCEGCDITADWSRSGQLLLGRGVPTRLFRYDLGSNREIELASHPRWNLHNARFSPDGTWVAFHSTNSPNVRRIYAAAASGRTPATFESWVPIVTDHGCHPNWSADGSLVYHFSFRDGAFCPWVQRVDGTTRRPVGTPRPVIHLHGSRLRAASGAAATSDVQGAHFYFTATESTGHIWLRER